MRAVAQGDGPAVGVVIDCDQKLAFGGWERDRLIEDESPAADLGDGEPLAGNEQLYLNLGRVAVGRGGAENVRFL